MIEGHDKVVDYLPAGTREEVIMPSRRCPHCKVESSYQVGAERVRFSLQLPYLLRLDTCRNEECACVTGVVFDGSTGEIVETFPQLESEPDELFPEGVKIAFRQALRSLNEKIWDGCVLMCRRALEEAMVDLGAKGKVLYDKIEDLANQNKITPDLRDWAHGDPRKKKSGGTLRLMPRKS